MLVSNKHTCSCVTQNCYATKISLKPGFKNIDSLPPFGCSRQNEDWTQASNTRCLLRNVIVGGACSTLPAIPAHEMESGLGPRLSAALDARSVALFLRSPTSAPQVEPGSRSKSPTVPPALTVIGDASSTPPNLRLCLGRCAGQGRGLPAVSILVLSSRCSPNS